MNTIYMIQSGDGGPVKIGLSKNPKKRLSQLQVSHPYTLRLIHIFAGGRDEEIALHLRFAEARIRGEWFHPLPEIVAGEVGLDRVSHPVIPRAPLRGYTEESKRMVREKIAANWNNPEWAAKRRALYAAVGPHLSETHHRREVSYLLRAAIAHRKAGCVPSAEACERYSVRHFEALSRVTGISRDDLHASLWAAPMKAAA